MNGHCDRTLEGRGIINSHLEGTTGNCSKQIAKVAQSQPFQSMSCLQFCHPNARFCSIGWDKTVAWCSYTTARHPLKALTAEALDAALQDLNLIFCG